jgi:hypothetical protein
MAVLFLSGAANSIVKRSGALSVPITNPGGQSTMMVCVFTWQNGNATSITYGGEALTQYASGSDIGITHNQNMWYLIDPPTGVNNLTANDTGGCHNNAMVGAIFEHVNLEAPFVNSNAGIATINAVTSASLSHDSQKGGLMLGLVTSSNRNANPSSSIAAPATQYTNAVGCDGCTGCNGINLSLGGTAVGDDDDGSTEFHDYNGSGNSSTRIVSYWAWCIRSNIQSQQIIMAV